MRGIRDAVGLLTRVPVARGGATTNLGDAVPLFPLVGAALGAGLAGIYFGCSLTLPHPVAAAIAVGSGMFLTGALHEDGLADATDALGATDPEKALRIMRDPEHGTYGVLALVLTTVIRISALASLDATAALAVLIGAHAIARAAAASGLRHAAARSSGSGASFASETTDASVRRGLAIGAMIGAASLGVWAIPSLAACLASSWAIFKGAEKRFGGTTGDVLGTAEQISEVVVFLIGAAVVAGRWPGLPWWR